MANFVFIDVYNYVSEKDETQIFNLDQIIRFGQDDEKVFLETTAISSRIMFGETEYRPQRITLRICDSVEEAYRELLNIYSKLEYRGFTSSGKDL